MTNESRAPVFTGFPSGPLQAKSWTHNGTQLANMNMGGAFYSDRTGQQTVAALDLLQGGGPLRRGGSEEGEEEEKENRGT